MYNALQYLTLPDWQIGDFPHVDQVNESFGLPLKFIMHPSSSESRPRIRGFSLVEMMT